MPENDPHPAAPSLWAWQNSRQKIVQWDCFRETKKGSQAGSKLKKESVVYKALKRISAI